MDKPIPPTAVAQKKDPELERIASAVAARFAASEATVRLNVPTQGATTVAHPSTLVDRLASAVGQRLAARNSIPSIDVLASAIAHRLAASPVAARLASSATRHFAKSWTEVDRLASVVAKRLQPDAAR